MQQIKQTQIQKIVRQNTPCFFCSTSYYIFKYHSYKKWRCYVQFPNGKTITKMKKQNEDYVPHECTVACPDFVLMNKSQMKHLKNAIEKAQLGLDFENPFSSKKPGWYCQVFGDFWHSEKIVGLSKEEHEKQVREAYESNGHKVLILWQKDIKNHWKEYCLPKINQFIKQFCKENDVDTNEIEINERIQNCLNDLSLKCLNNPIEYRRLQTFQKESVLQNIFDVYKGIEFTNTLYQARLDFDNFKKLIVDGFKAKSNIGNDLLDTFIKSRYDSHVKNNKSINELKRDQKLMKHGINELLMTRDDSFHFKKIIRQLQKIYNISTVQNLNQSLIYLRLFPFSKKDGIFFDPCAGWGGRMLASYAFGMKYIAIDANKQLVEELKELAKFMQYDAEIYYGDSSDERFVKRVLKERQIDLSLICPPYFDKQIYSDDEYQSINMYPDREQWHKYFLNYVKNSIVNNLSKDGKIIVSTDGTLDFRELTNVCLQQFQCTKCSEREDKFFLVTPTSEFCKEQIDFVRCAICGQSYKKLGWHLMKTHNQTVQQYLQTYPDNKIICEKQSEKIKEIHTKKTDEIKTYIKRNVYLLPDGRYTGKSDKYKRQWGIEEIKEQHIIDASTVKYVPQYCQDIVNGIQGIDYVVCKICGYKKGTLTQHLRKEHNLTKQEYEIQYCGQVYSKKSKEAFHQCSLNKWKTQFQTGQSKRAEPKKKVQNPKNAQRTDITLQQIVKLQNQGKSLIDLQKHFGCSQPTLYKYMKKFGYQPMSRTLNTIKKAVFQLGVKDLSTQSLQNIQNNLKTLGKEKTMKLYGVRRTIFDTWISQLKK